MTKFLQHMLVNSRRLSSQKFMKIFSGQFNTFVNEMKVLSHKMNIDIYEVIKAASTKPFKLVPFYPGPGFGGHCIPVDPFLLSWKAKEFNFSTRLLTIRQINESCLIIL